MKRIARTLIAAVLCMAFAAHAQKIAPAASASMQGEGINVRMFSSRPTFGTPEDPTFWVHAAHGQRLDDPPVWTLEDARAVIYRSPEEDLILVAKSGTVDETNKAASLDGSVRVTSGQMVVELANIRWDDAAGIARSDATATMDDGVNRIVGESIALYADEDRFEIGRGSAHIRLAQAPDPDQTDSEAPKKASQFESIEIPEYTSIGGNIDTGRITEIRGPAHLILNGVDPADTLSIQADHIKFEYDGNNEDDPYSRIILTGHVELKHSAATFRSNQGAIDFANRKARFEGDVVMTGDQVEEATGEYFELDLDTGDYRLGGAKSSVKKIWLVVPKNAEKPAVSQP